MKRLSFFFAVLLCLPSLLAQTTEVKTVLYLLPFFGDEYQAHKNTSMLSPADIDNEPIFSLVSFWEGAQMALDEYESGVHRINVIVKDITYDDEKLTRIMEDEVLMSQVDLIIGPFFASQFEIAANYAKKHQIPIVNPFTSKQSILEDNEYVYKVQASAEAIAELVLDRQKRQYAESEVLFWTEKGADILELRNCEQYFTQLEIPYEFILDGDKSSVKSHIRQNKSYMVFPFFQTNTTVIAKMRNLGIENDFPNTVFVIPEEWLEISALEVDYLNKLNVHFFSDYFVNEENDNTLVFISDFIERYGTPPDLKRFSFQGYDITKYFVELMLHGFDASQVHYAPVAMKFDFQKTENGGYENHGVFFLQLKDYKIKEAE